MEGRTRAPWQDMNEVNSQFWLFSLFVYAVDGVQQECLDLQDRYGVDVNLLLFCAYVGAIHAAVLTTADIDGASAITRQWHEGVVRKLRETRRALKPFSIGASPIATPAGVLRTKIKAGELEAERIEHFILEEWSHSRIGTWSRTESATAIAANIRTLLAGYNGVAPQPKLPNRLIAASVARTVG